MPTSICSRPSPAAWSLTVWVTMPAPMCWSCGSTSKRALQKRTRILSKRNQVPGQTAVFAGLPGIFMPC